MIPIDLIVRCNYKIITLQFPDENVVYCTEIYSYMKNRLSQLLGELSNDINLYIIADSAYGSSIDDVSAQHVNRDLSVYFANDLIGVPSNTENVITVTMHKPIDIVDCVEKITEYYSNHYINSVLLSSRVNHQCVLLIYDACYYHAIEKIKLQLNPMIKDIYIASFQSSFSKSSDPVVTCKNRCSCNNSGDNSDSNGGDSSNTGVDSGVSHGSSNDISSLGSISLGGLLIPEVFVSQNNGLIIYIGEKQRQLFCIAAYLHDNPVHCYDPTLKTFDATYADGIKDSREYRERYGGIAKVKDSKIIGILVGSMGLTGDLMKEIVNRLKLLINAAGKSYYFLVMGRINESKLCNFPDIDLFVLISNETEIIKPKTFHVPGIHLFISILTWSLRVTHLYHLVITPWELEVGLGAREWAVDSGNRYKTNLQLLLDFDIAVAINNVREYNKNEDSSSDDEVSEEINNLALVKGHSNALSNIHNFISIEKFKEKTYQGLVPDISAEIKEQNNQIVAGLHGIASGYDKK